MWSGASNPVQRTTTKSRPHDLHGSQAHHPFRHHAPRRRAGPASEPLRTREDADRTRPRAARGRRDRDGLSRILPRRLRERAQHRFRSQACGALRPLPRRGGRHRRLCRGAQGGRAVPHPHLHRHVRHSREGQAAQGLRQDPRDGRRGRQARPQLHGRRRIFLRGRGPHADRPSLPHGGGRDRCGRHDRQHSRHRGLHGARGVRRHHHDALQPRAQHRQGDHFGALPQRPRHGHGQLDHRHSARRAPDRVLHERSGRACGQLLARGGRHGDQAAREVARRSLHGHQPEADRPHLGPRLQNLQRARARAQGDRGLQRLRALVGHSSGRRPQEPRDLRDPHARERGLHGQHDAHDGALGPPHDPRLARQHGLQGRRIRSERNLRALPEACRQEGPGL